MHTINEWSMLCLHRFRYLGDDRKITKLTKLANRMHASAPLYLMTHEIKKTK